MEKHGRYVGPIEHLYGRTALVHIPSNGETDVLAQFDDARLKSKDGISLGFGWHKFQLSDFHFPW